MCIRMMEMMLRTRSVTPASTTAGLRETGYKRVDHGLCYDPECYPRTGVFEPCQILVPFSRGPHIPTVPRANAVPTLPPRPPESPAIDE
jgi:hypothetical protein